jgi:hypothetical protein
MPELAQKKIPQLLENVANRYNDTRRSTATKHTHNWYYKAVNGCSEVHKFLRTILHWGPEWFHRHRKTGANDGHRYR